MSMKKKPNLARLIVGRMGTAVSVLVKLHFQCGELLCKYFDVQLTVE